VLKRGFLTQTGDMVSTYPHAAEKEMIFLRIPAEFVEDAGDDDSSSGVY
jgi:hypothetical protein